MTLDSRRRHLNQLNLRRWWRRMKLEMMRLELTIAGHWLPMNWLLMNRHSIDYFQRFRLTCWIW